MTGGRGRCSEYEEGEREMYSASGGSEGSVEVEQQKRSGRREGGRGKIRSWAVK